MAACLAGVLLVGAFLAMVAVLNVVATVMVAGAEAEEAKTIHDARTSLIQLLGGVSLVGGFVYTVRTFALTRATRRSERFTTAVAQVGDPTSPTMRTGGVHSLGLLTREDSAYWPVVDDVLSSLVRERATPGVGASPDVETALHVLGRCPVSLRRSSDGLDLRGVHLPGVGLAGANLERARLNGAVLNGADLSDVRMVRALLVGADLQSVDLAGADLTEADLSGADLRGASFYGAVLRATNLAGATLDEAEQLTAAQRAVATGLSDTSTA